MEAHNRREKIQENAISNMLECAGSETTGFSFHEIGTGAGKTKIGLEVAKKLLSEGRSVLVSAPNNFLLFSFVDEWKKWGGNPEDIEVVIGRDNYIQRSIALSPVFLSNFSLDAEVVKKWLDEHEGREIISLFIADFLLPEEAEDFLKGDIPIIDEEGDIETGANIPLEEVAHKVQEGGKIFLTNHFYLIYLLLYGSKEGMKDITVIIDEVHLLNNVARSIFRNTFSPYRLKFLLSQVLGEKLIPKTHFPKARKIMGQCETIMNKAAAKAHKGIGEEEAAKMVAACFGPKDIFGFGGVLMRAAKKHSSAKVLRATRGEMKELGSVLSQARKMGSQKRVAVSFSAIKKYPSFSAYNMNPIAFLRKMFVKNDITMIGMSGTIRCVPSEGIEDNRWSFDRLGIRTIQFMDGKENDEALLFNQKVLGLKLFVYERVFNREQMEYLIETGKRFKIPAHTKGKRSEQEDREWSRWVKSHADLVKEQFRGSGLILMSSFENTEAMVEALNENGFGDDYRILSHSRWTPMHKVVDQYRIAVGLGEKVVLVGGLPFYTGINLPGNLLETLYISKIPNEPITNFYEKQGVELYSSKIDMIRNALITFRQGLGRPLRGPDDSAFVIVADPRIVETRYRVFLDFIEESGVEA